MSKFTKGPWECVAAEFGEKDSDNEGLVAFWTRMPEQVLCKADADLVSAAPEMYEALADILEELENSRTGLDGCADIDNFGGPNWAMSLLRAFDRHRDILAKVEAPNA